jgi:enoyl reductase-like protein
MRAKEFITERSFSQRKSGPMATTFQFPSMPSSDGYQSYRFGLAMANHKIAPTSPTAQHAVITAYTPEEEEIIRAGERATGHKKQIVADRGSHELKGTETVSPVAQAKRNRYGV